MLSERIISGGHAPRQRPIPHAQQHGDAAAASRDSRTRVPALRARAVLRAAVPVLLVQPLPVRRRSAPTPYFERLREEMRMVADLGYDFAVDVRRRRHADHRHRRARRRRSTSPGSSSPSRRSPRRRTRTTSIPSGSTRSSTACERFSVGVQSLRRRAAQADGPLRQVRLGEQILERLQSIEGAFHSLNVDMIFNFPSQTAGDARAATSSC